MSPLFSGAGVEVSVLRTEVDKVFGDKCVSWEKLDIQIEINPKFCHHQRREGKVVWDMKEIYLRPSSLLTPRAKEGRVILAFSKVYLI